MTSVLFPIKCLVDELSLERLTINEKGDFPANTQFIAIEQAFECNLEADRNRQPLVK